MIRIDTASIPKGKNIHITIVSMKQPVPIIESLNPITETIEGVQYTIDQAGSVWIVSVLTKEYDGFLLITIGDKRIVKKVGSPIGYFVVGMNSNASSIVAYELNNSGVLIKSSNAHSVWDGFFMLKLHPNTDIVRIVDKYYDIRTYDSNLGVSVDIEHTSIQDITLLEYNLHEIEIQNIELQDFSMPTLNFQDIRIPNTTIKEV